MVLYNFFKGFIKWLNEKNVFKEVWKDVLDDRVDKGDRDC